MISIMITDKQIPKKFVRPVHPYKKKIRNKIIRVDGYRQTYVKPRGPVSKFKQDRLTSKSQTLWLMDRYGRFVGRANYKGNTSATGVYKMGYDATSNIRDAQHYKRVFGRASSKPNRSRTIRK